MSLETSGIAALLGCNDTKTIQAKGAMRKRASATSTAYVAVAFPTFAKPITPSLCALHHAKIASCAVNGSSSMAMARPASVI